MHISPVLLPPMRERSLTRVGSPSALNTRAIRSACSDSSAPLATVPQQAVSAWVGSGSAMVMVLILPVVLTSVDVSRILDVLMLVDVRSGSWVFLS